MCPNLIRTLLALLGLVQQQPHTLELTFTAPLGIWEYHP